MGACPAIFTFTESARVSSVTATSGHFTVEKLLVNGNYVVEDYCLPVHYSHGETPVRLYRLFPVAGQNVVAMSEPLKDYGTNRRLVN